MRTARLCATGWRKGFKITLLSTQITANCTPCGWADTKYCGSRRKNQETTNKCPNKQNGVTPTLTKDAETPVGGKLVLREQMASSTLASKRKPHNSWTEPKSKKVKKKVRHHPQAFIIARIGSVAIENILRKEKTNPDLKGLGEMLAEFGGFRKGSHFAAEWRKQN